MSPITTNIIDTNDHLSLIFININVLSYPIKRHKLTDWACKQDPAFCCTQETHSNDKDRDYFRVKEWSCHSNI